MKINEALNFSIISNAFKRPLFHITDRKSILNILRRNSIRMSFSAADPIWVQNKRMDLYYLSTTYDRGNSYAIDLLRDEINMYSPYGGGVYINFNRKIRDFEHATVQYYNYNSKIINSYVSEKEVRLYSDKNIIPGITRYIDSIDLLVLDVSDSVTLSVLKEINKISRVKVFVYYSIDDFIKRRNKRSLSSMDFSKIKNIKRIKTQKPQSNLDGEYNELFKKMYNEISKGKKYIPTPGEIDLINNAIIYLKKTKKPPVGFNKLFSLYKKEANVEVNYFFHNWLVRNTVM